MTRKNNRHLLLINNCIAAIAASALWFCPAFAHAQAASDLAQMLPQRPVLIVVPNAAGGPNDIAARLLAPRLADTVKQNFIVDNRASANGVTGTDYVAKATPNGTFLSIGNTGTHAINGSLYKKPLYDPVRDFVAVAPVMTGGLVFAIHAKLPAQNFKEFVAYTKAQGGKVNAAIAGATGEIATNAIKMMAGANMNNVPYKGGIPAVIAVAAGESHMVLTNPSGVQPQIDSGRLRAIAVTGAKRSAAAPDIPTIAESGVPGYQVSNWFGISACAGTPPDTIARLHADIARALKTPEVKAAFNNAGADPGDMTTAQFTAFFQQEYTKWAKVVQAAGIKGE